MQNYAELRGATIAKNGYFVIVLGALCLTIVSDNRKNGIQKKNLRMVLCERQGTTPLPVVRILRNDLMKKKPCRGYTKFLIKKIKRHFVRLILLIRTTN